MSFHIGRRVIIHQEESDHLSNDSNRGGEREGEGGKENPARLIMMLQLHMKCRDIPSK